MEQVEFISLLPSQADILAQWGAGEQDEILPVISILCPTYNQLAYLRLAVQGFLVQRTKYPFEVLIRDDASTDGTQAFLCELRQAYPKIVRVMQNEVNDFHLGIWKPFSDLFSFSRGEYIAFCEGDDVWRDPLKLQTQMKALALGAGSSFSYCDCDDLLPSGLLAKGSFSELANRFTSRALLRGKVLPMCTLLFRKEDLCLSPQMRSSPCLDVFIQAALSLKGDALNACIDVPCAYRVHPDGFWSGASSTSRFHMILITLASLLSFFYSSNQYRAGWLTLMRLLDFIPLESSEVQAPDFIVATSPCSASWDLLGHNVGRSTLGSSRILLELRMLLYWARCARRFLLQHLVFALVGLLDPGALIMKSSSRR